MVKVKTIMSENVITINENATIAEAAKLMSAKHIKDLLITKKNSPIAMVTIHDLIKGMVDKRKKVKDVMNKNFAIISPKTNYYNLISIMKEKKVAIFPVIENNKIAGIVSEADIINTTRNFTKFHQIMQDSILVIFGFATIFFLYLSYTTT